MGREVIPALKEGHATVRITALNDSWGRFFRGGRSEVVLDLPVRFAPPQIAVLTHAALHQPGRLRYGGLYGFARDRRVRRPGG